VWLFKNCDLQMFLRARWSTKEGNFPLREIINEAFRVFAGRIWQPLPARLTPAANVTVLNGFKAATIPWSGTTPMKNGLYSVHILMGDASGAGPAR
jgi:hypothetical protein